jgi:hypothetical protein
MQQPGFQQPPIGGQPPQGQPPQGMPPQQQNYQNNPFQGLTSGDPSATRHPFLKDGSYKLALHAVKFVQSRGGKALYIIESDITASNNPLSPVGMRVSSFIDMSNMDTRGRHIASFVTATHGYDPSTLPKDSPNAPWADPQTSQQMPWDYYAMQSVHDTNPWQGREVGVHVQTIKTQAGRDFSLHTWVPIQSMGELVAAAQPVPEAAPQQQEAPQQQPPQQQPPQSGNWGGPPNQGGNWGGQGR